MSSLARPDISVVVVVYNMAREAPRTLYSLSAAYQQHIASDDYEVIIVDNGSTPPVDNSLIAGLAGNFRVIRMEPSFPSPARAINRGLSEARGSVVGVMIDGARIATPGLLHFARHGARLYERPVVATLGWYLGFDLQKWAIEGGYDRAREDALLASIDWPNDGYRLFEIGTPDESSVDGWVQPIAESNALFLPRASWDLLRGVDERFDAPGGGMLNPDTFCRAMELPSRELVVLLGEATFHQLHGGTTTNARLEDFIPATTSWHKQYEAIRGQPWRTPKRQKRTYVGTLPPAALPHFARSLLDPIRHTPPLGRSFDRELWTKTSLKRPDDPTIAALVDLAAAEFRARRFQPAAAVSRLARSRAPDEPAALHLLSHAGPSLRRRVPPDERMRATFHLALGKAHALLGETEAAAEEFRAALAVKANMAEAHFALADLRWPGDNYRKWLSRLHRVLSPENYLEIGISRGLSLALARSPTRAIGVDPMPNIRQPLKAETHIYCETSDAFFAQGRLTPLLEGRPLALAFIDGLHLFEQALKDFMHVESHCAPNSVVLIHDTIPLDEPTQRRQQVTAFHTGDVWKTVLCLKHYRPDFTIFTIATPPAGLTVVTGLNPASRILVDRYDEAVKRFIEMPYSDIEHRLEDALNIVPNEWSAVKARLKALGILRTMDVGRGELSDVQADGGQ